MNIALWILQILFGLLRGEYQNIVMNLILVAIMAFITYGRTKLAPLSDRNTAPAAAS